MKSIKCSVCGKEATSAIRSWIDPKTNEWKCAHDLSDIGSGDLEAMRKENRQATMDAQAMAGRAAADAEAEDPTVEIKVPRDPKIPSNQFSGNVKVKTSILDSIEEKTKEGLDLTPPTE